MIECLSMCKALDLIPSITHAYTYTQGSIAIKKKSLICTRNLKKALFLILCVRRKWGRFDKGGGKEGKLIL
jgi:hypothetical protein